MTDTSLQQKFVSLSKRRYLILTILMIGSALICVGLAVKQIAATLDIREDYQAEQQKIAEVHARAAQIEAIINSPEFAQSQDTVDRALPDKKPFLELLANLDLVGRATSVALSNLSISPGQLATESAGIKKSSASSTKDYDILELSYEVTSTFDAFREFMQLMEKVAPFTTITKFDISDKKDSLDSVQAASASSQLVSVNVTSHTYFFTKPPSAAAVSKPLNDSQRTVLTEVEQLQAIDLPVQDTISGGGREDLFGIKGYKDIIRNTAP